MKYASKILIPILIIILSSLIQKGLLSILDGDVLSTISMIINNLTCILLGVVLNGNFDNMDDIPVFKILVFIIIILLFCVQLNYIDIPKLNEGFDLLGIEEIHMYLIYIVCGYLLLL